MNAQPRAQEAPVLPAFAGANAQPPLPAQEALVLPAVMDANSQEVPAQAPAGGANAQHVPPPQQMQQPPLPNAEGDAVYGAIPGLDEDDLAGVDILVNIPGLFDGLGDGNDGEGVDIPVDIRGLFDN